MAIWNYLLPALGAGISTLIGDQEKKRQLARIRDEVEASAAETTGLVTRGYEDVRADIETAYTGAEEDLEAAYADAQTQLEQGFKDAQQALEAGNAEAAEQILKGLGLSVEEINKWADIAAEGMQWVVDWGQEGIPYARAYLKEMSDAIMNPDAIYDSQIWKSHKSEVMDSMTNTASARAGVLHGNTMAGIADRISKDAMAVRQNQITALQQGYATEAQRIGAGTAAQGALANLQMSRGTNLAALQQGAYNQLAQNRLGLGTGVAGLQQGLGTGLANLGVGLAGQRAGLQTGAATNLANLGVGQMTDLANIQMGTANNLANIRLASAQANPWGDIGNILATTAGNVYQQQQPNVGYENLISAIQQGQGNITASSYD